MNNLSICESERLYWVVYRYVALWLHRVLQKWSSDIDIRLLFLLLWCCYWWNCVLNEVSSWNHLADWLSFCIRRIILCINKKLHICWWCDKTNIDCSCWGIGHWQDWMPLGSCQIILERQFTPSASTFPSDLRKNFLPRHVVWNAGQYSLAFVLNSSPW